MSPSAEALAVAAPDDPLTELWRAVSHVARARLAVLDDALLGLRRRDADAPARCSAAHEESHKLVGSLDSYGRTGGSALALRAAVLLEQHEPDLDELAQVLAQLHATVDSVS